MIYEIAVIITLFVLSNAFQALIDRIRFPFLMHVDLGGSVSDFRAWQKALKEHKIKHKHARDKDKNIIVRFGSESDLTAARLLL